MEGTDGWLDAVPPARIDPAGVRRPPQAPGDAGTALHRRPPPTSSRPAARRGAAEEAPDLCA